MPERRRIHTPAPLRSSLSNAAFAVEERVVWGGVDVLRGVIDVVKWPFERTVWAIERGLVWPLEKRADSWSGPIRAVGAAGLAVCAIGAGVLGLLWASGSGSGATAPQTRQAAAPVAAPIAKQTTEEAPAQAEPVLQGVTPNFAPAAGGTSSKAAAGPTAKAAEAANTGAGGTADSSAASSSSTASAKATEVAPVGPVATKVARQFAGAFVLYETGRDDAKVREGFAATATPKLVHELMQRPPRLPANVEVPKAKVLNVVAGPKQGGTYTLSVSLLRVGITSELRIDMQRDEKSAEWRVTDVRG